MRRRDACQRITGYLSRALEPFGPLPIPVASVGRKQEAVDCLPHEGVSEAVCLLRLVHLENIGPYGFCHRTRELPLRWQCRHGTQQLMVKIPLAQRHDPLQQPRIRRRRQQRTQLFGDVAPGQANESDGVGGRSAHELVDERLEGW